MRGTTEIIDIRPRANDRAIVTARSALRASGDLVPEQTGEIVVRQRRRLPA